MKRKVFLLIALFCFSFYANAQDSLKYPNRYVDYGLIRVQGNIALGTSTKTNATNIYWANDIDCYVKGNISISGGTWIFINSFNGDKLFKANHMGYLGASYHFKTNNHIDPFIGILPGFSINQLNAKSPAFADSTQPLSRYPWAINPLFVMSAGVNYYANRFFNVFIHVKYQTGKHYSDIAPVPLNEVKVSFGLGYMLWARKHYLRFRKPYDTSQ